VLHVLLIALLLAGPAGCALRRPMTVPMQMLQLPAQCAAPVETLVVFLPGAYSRPEEFVREGIVRALRERHIAADAWIVDAHLGYYEQRSIIERIQADVFVPARQRGYRRIWLVGVSIGGFGALIHSLSHPGEVEGIVVIAPYLGQRTVLEPIRASGGLRAWKAPAGELTLDQMDTILWRWLQGYLDAREPRPPLYLGAGRDDRFADAHAVLGAALPPERVVMSAGGHDWSPWREVWRQILPTLPLPVDASCSDRAESRHPG
jgi:pimeloyl-ACP methyl ester carboxylesterase